MANQSQVGIEITGDASKFKREIDQAQGSLANFQASVGSFARGMSGIVAGISFAKVASELISSAASVDRVNKSLTTIAGSSLAAANEYQFVVSEAKRMGIGIEDAAQSYVQLAAAAKGTALEGAQTKTIFSSVAQAVAALGGSSDQASGALLAIGQMISKGTVQAEELRGQLGERLPGAFQIASKAMGVTTAELGKMLQNGQVMADEFLPKFAAELDKTYASARFDSITNNINRISNAWERLKNVVATGLHLPQGIENLANNIEVIGKGFSATFGSDKQSEIERTELRIHELNDQVDKMLKFRSFSPKLVDESSLQSANAEILKLQGHLDDLRKPAPAVAASPESMGPSVDAWKQYQQVLADSSKEFREFQVTREIKAAREAGDVQALTRLYREQLAAKSSSKLTEGDRNAMAATMAQDDVTKSLTKSTHAAAKAYDHLQENIKSTLGNLRQEAETVGMTAEQSKLYELSVLGASQAQMAEANSLIGTIATKKSKIQADKDEIETLRNLALLKYENATADDKTIADLQEELKLTQMTTTEIDKYQAAKKLSVNATADQRAQVDGLVGQIDAAKKQQEFAQSVAQQLSGTVDQVFSAMITKGGDIKQAFLDMATGIAKMGVQLLIVKPLMESLANTMKGGGSSGGGGSGIFGSILGAVGSFFGFANGGIMSPSGPIPLMSYASGGIANRPQLALFGEGHHNEAYVPLPDGRSIPVTMKMAGHMPTGGNGGGTVVQIIDQRKGGQPATVEHSRDSNNKELVRVMIRDEVKNAMSSGYMDKTMQTNYGVRRPGAMR